METLARMDLDEAAIQALAAMQPFSTGGTYANYLDEGRTADASYDAAAYARLVALKNRYDPENLFRQNVNIPPMIS